MRHGRAEAGSIKDCAAAHGVSVRAVRAWRSSGDPRWLQWKRKVAEGACQLTLGGVGVVGTGPEAELAACERRFAAIQAVVDGYAERGDNNSLVVAMRVAEAAQKMVHQAREHARLRAEAAGEIIEKGVVVEAFRAWSSPVTTMLRELPARLASELPAEVAVLVEESARRIIAAEMSQVVKQGKAEMAKIIGEEAMQ